MPWVVEENEAGIDRARMCALVREAAERLLREVCPKPKRVLLLPPDITRAHSGAGWITREFYNFFAPMADTHLIPTLGQHVPHTPEQNRWMFGDIPEERIHVHDWRGGSRIIGEVPAEFVRARSNGLADWAIPVSVNTLLLDGGWDIILNIGHIVPHEVLGFANHNKNYFIGLGGKPMICASHMMAACCGIENNLGQLTTPLRACFNFAQENFLAHLPDAFFQVVMAYDQKHELAHTGVYFGADLETYLAGARASARQNVTAVPPLKKVVAVMQGDEFYSTWVANKAVYRTRKAIADGGELLIIAPGLERFGEQKEVDDIIRKYGYCGREKVMQLWRDCPQDGDLKEMTHATAHLIHGSSDGRFMITYAPGKLSREEINTVGYNYADLAETLARYNPQRLKNGFNTLEDGEEIYFINTPSAGLWTAR